MKCRSVLENVSSRKLIYMRAKNEARRTGPGTWTII